MKVCGVCVRTLKPQGFCEFLCEIRLTQRRKVAKRYVLLFFYITNLYTVEIQTFEKLLFLLSFWGRQFNTFVKMLHTGKHRMTQKYLHVSARIFMCPFLTTNGHQFTLMLLICNQQIKQISLISVLHSEPFNLCNHVDR